MSCFISKQENFNYDLKNSEVELWKNFSLNKAKEDHKVLSFGSKSYELGTHVNDNMNKNIKSVFIIHVRNDFDMQFW